MTDIRDPAQLATALKSCDDATLRQLFGRIHEACANQVYTLAVRLVGDPREAEDVYQETFIAVWQNLRKFRGEAQISTWIHRITIRIAGKRRRRPWAELPDRLAAGAAPDSPMLRRELREALEQALDALSPEHRMVLVLFSLDGQSAKDIAALLGVPEGTIWSRLHYARKALSAAMQRYLH